MKFPRSSRRLNARLRMLSKQVSAGSGWPVQFSQLTQRNLRNFFYDGFYASASDAITLTYLTLYLLALGATEAQIGWLTALSSIAAVLLLLPGAMLVDRYGRRRKIVVTAGGWFGRVPLLLMALLPFFFEGSSAIYLAIALKVLLDGARNLALPAWISLTADIVPLTWRGRYFGNRNLMMGISAMVMIFVIGELITRIGTPGGYQWAMGLAFGIGMLSTHYFGRIRELESITERTQPSRYSLKSLLSTLRGDRRFTLFCVYTALWGFSLNIAGPFFSVYHVQTLGATASIVGITTIITRISSLPSQRFWGRLTDQWGANKLSMISGFLIPVLPVMWLFVRSPWGVIPINILSGVFWSGYTLATFNLLLEISPDEQRARYSAMYQISVAASAAIGAAIGGLIANQWGIPVLFVLSGIGRLLSATFFFGSLYRKNVSTPTPLPSSDETTLSDEPHESRSEDVPEQTKNNEIIPLSLEQAAETIVPDPKAAESETESPPEETDIDEPQQVETETDKPADHQSEITPPQNDPDSELGSDHA